MDKEDDKTEQPPETETEATTKEDIDKMALNNSVSPASPRVPPPTPGLTTTQAIALGVGIGVCLRAIFK